MQEQMIGVDQQENKKDKDGRNKFGEDNLCCCYCWYAVNVGVVIPKLVEQYRNDFPQNSSNICSRLGVMV